MPFMGLSQAEKRQLEMEVVPAETHLKLTRLIRERCNSRESAIQLVWIARFVNMANHVMNRYAKSRDPGALSIPVDNRYVTIWHRDTTGFSRSIRITWTY